MTKLPGARKKEWVRMGAVVVATALACIAPPGRAEWPPSALRLQIDPPGAVRGRVYRGALRSATGRAVFAGATAVRVRALRPESLTALRVLESTDAEVRIECRVEETAADTEALFVALDEGERRHEVSVLLRTIEPPWDPAWRPVAVAPADTAVADSTCEVVLDARRSQHPAGLDAMHFRWDVDEGAVVIKGGLVTSTRLPAGRHAVVLVAEDAFGYVSRDTLRVQVGPAGK